MWISSFFKEPTASLRGDTCLRLQFLDVETNPGPWCPVPTVCRLLGSNVCCLAMNLSDLTVLSSQYDILLWSETLVSEIRHVLELQVPVLVALSCCARAGSLGPEEWQHMYAMDMENFDSPSLSVVVAKWFLGFVVRDRTYMYSVFTATLT